MIEHINQGRLNARIVTLIVNKLNCGAVSIAEKNNIPYIYIDHKEFNSREQYEKKIITALLKFSFDIIVMAGWMRIASPVLINQYKNRIINIHPSILPSFKGRYAVKAALDSKAKITGCTVHIVSSEVDSGEIIVQGSLAILENDDEKSLHERIKQLEYRILPIGIEIFSRKLKSNYG